MQYFIDALMEENEDDPLSDDRPHMLERCESGLPDA